MLKANLYGKLLFNLFSGSDGGSTPVMDERSDEEDIRHETEDLEVIKCKNIT